MRQNKKSAAIPVIGITGGVGSGKSAVLAMLEKYFDTAVIQADQVARELMQPGKASYVRIVDCFGKDILEKDGSIDRNKLSGIVFQDAERLEQLNSMTHPEVKKEILSRIARIKSEGRVRRIAVEAALLIEGGYREYLDELWYIYADDATRIARLKEGRGYSEEKSRSIMENQLGEAEFRTECDSVIDNSRGYESLFAQLKRKIDGRPEQEKSLGSGGSPNLPQK